MALAYQGVIRRVSGFKAAMFAVGLSAVFAGVCGAQEKPTLTIVGFETLRNNLMGLGVAEGGVNLAARFEKEFDTKIDFVLETSTSIKDALNRLGTLPQTKEDLIYSLDMEGNRRFAAFLEPLNDYMAKKPIPDFPAAWPVNFTQANSIDGKLYRFPVRCGTFGLWYNTELLAARGVSAPPKTPDELLDAARKMTYVKANGQKVYGFALRGTKFDTDTLAIVVRMFGGELIAPDLKIEVNSPPTVRAITFLQQMYKEGLIPPNWASMGGPNVDQVFKEEFAAMIPAGTAYGPRYADGKSAVSGKAKLTFLPLIAERQTPDKPFSDSITFSWNIGILKGSKNKDLAYEFIRFLARPDVQLEMVRNENGPCSFTTHDELGKKDPDMALTSKILKYSRQPVPGHTNMNQARDMIAETIQSIVVGNLAVKPELDGLEAKLKRILR